MSEQELWAKIHELERRIAFLNNGSPDKTVYARYETNTAQSIANAAQAIVNYEDKVIDTHDCVTVGAAWKFTCKRSGYYIVDAYNRLASSDTWALTEGMNMSIYKNAALYSQISRPPGMDTSAGAVSLALGGGDGIYLVVGDYIDIELYQNSGGAIALDGTAADNHVSIYCRSDYI